MSVYGKKFTLPGQPKGTGHVQTLTVNQRGLPTHSYRCAREGHIRQVMREGNGERVRDGDFLHVPCDCGADGLYLRHLLTPQPLEDWHEEDGPVLWVRFPLDEPPYCGGPLDSDWPGYHTHWLPITTLHALGHLQPEED